MPVAVESDCPIALLSTGLWSPWNDTPVSMEVRVKVNGTAGVKSRPLPLLSWKAAVKLDTSSIKKDATTLDPRLSSMSWTEGTGQRGRNASLGSSLTWSEHYFGAELRHELEVVRRGSQQIKCFGLTVGCVIEPKCEVHGSGVAQLKPFRRYGRQRELHCVGNIKELATGLADGRRGGSAICTAHTISAEGCACR